MNPEALAFPPGVAERIDALVAQGEPEAALETFMREVVRASPEQLGAIRAQPSWPARVAAAHTITREGRAEVLRAFDPREAEQITVPVLLLTGGDSPALFTDDVEPLATALPDARVVVIEGQQHLGDVLAPEVFAQQVLKFLRDQD